MNKTPKKIAAGASLAALSAAVAAASSYVTTRFLVKIALDRRPPKVVQMASTRISGGKGISDVFLQQIEGADRLLRQVEMETVTITAADGTELTGHWRPHPQAKRVIIAMHGWRSTWSRDFGMIAPFWEENGCSVLFAEQRGQNNSGGEYMGFGLTERYDVLDWIAWVTQRCGSELPIYLGGVSMGATTVLMAAGLELPGNVHGIMADCGFTSPEAIWRHVASDNLHLPLGYWQSVADSICKKRLQLDSMKYSTLDALKTSKIPVILAHGTDDHFVPVEMSYQNYAACAGPKRLLVVPGADHGMSYFIDRGNYERAVRDFWREFDHPAGDSKE